MKKILKIVVCFIGIMISASTVSASKLEILSESEDYEKIVELADEIVSVTNGGPVEDPFEEGISVSDIDFDNALKISSASASFEIFTFFVPFLLSSATKSISSLIKFAFTFQYSSGTNASISRSFSTIKRNATD